MVNVGGTKTVLTGRTVAEGVRPGVGLAVADAGGVLLAAAVPVGSGAAVSVAEALGTVAVTSGTVLVGAA
jgi:pantoate kinase